jgi:hypothetical protein
MWTTHLFPILDRSVMANVRTFMRPIYSNKWTDSSKFTWTNKPYINSFIFVDNINSNNKIVKYLEVDGNPVLSTCFYSIVKAIKLSLLASRVALDAAAVVINGWETISQRVHKAWSKIQKA